MPRRRSPRFTARRKMPSIALQLNPRRRLMAWIVVSRNQSSTIISNFWVYRLCLSAQAIATYTQPCSGHCPPRNIGFYPGLILASVQVPPAARSAVVTRTNLPAMQASQRAIRSDAHCDGLERLADRHIKHPPRLAQAENLRVEVGIAHARIYNVPTCCALTHTNR